MTRSQHEKAREALQAAYDACYNHPDRGAVGMSHGPFSGVNVALAAIASLESELAVTKAKLARREKQLIFPVALRKMWSGGEVQAWINKQTADVQA